MTKEVMCESCSHVISNPICERCLLKQASYWLSENRIEKSAKGKIIKQIRDNFSKEHSEGQICIFCQKEAYRRCAYCFFFKAALLLSKQKISQDKIESFLEVFNYRHFREDYHILDNDSDSEIEFSKIFIK